MFQSPLKATDSLIWRADLYQTYFALFMFNTWIVFFWKKMKNMENGAAFGNKISVYVQLERSSYIWRKAWFYRVWKCGIWRFDFLYRRADCSYVMILRCHSYIHAPILPTPPSLISGAKRQKFCNFHHDRMTTRPTVTNLWRWEWQNDISTQERWFYIHQ